MARTKTNKNGVITVYKYIDIGQIRVGGTAGYSATYTVGSPTSIGLIMGLYSGNYVLNVYNSTDNLISRHHFFELPDPLDPEKGDNPYHSEEIPLYPMANYPNDLFDFYIQLKDGDGVTIGGSDISVYYAGGTLTYSSASKKYTYYNTTWGIVNVTNWRPTGTHPLQVYKKISDAWRLMHDSYRTYVNAGFEIEIPDEPIDDVIYDKFPKNYKLL